jgi:hypothetical protein
MSTTDALRFCIGYDCIEWRNKRGSICSCKKCFELLNTLGGSSIGAGMQIHGSAHHYENMLLVTEYVRMVLPLVQRCKFE